MDARKYARTKSHYCINFKNYHFYYFYFYMYIPILNESIQLLLYDMTESSSNSNLSADAAHYLHVLLVLYVVIGWLVTPMKYLHYYILLVLFILLDWNDHDGECSLTKLEHHLRYSQEERTSRPQPEFFRPLVNKLFNLSLTSEQANRLNYFTFILGILFAFLRHLYHCKKCI